MSIESRRHQYGTVFQHWQIQETLGKGSGGKTAVFRLKRVDSDRGQSALKVINLIEERGDFNSRPDFLKKEYETARKECMDQAIEEVYRMADFQGNTNIVDYLDHEFVNWVDEAGFGCDLLIRMELLKDLRNEIQSGKLFTDADIIQIGSDICRALILCHRKGILHRDIKPENIFINRNGDYKLGDFGISRIIGSSPMSMAGTAIGTPEYAAPEQISGKYDKRVDIYSLGLVLYELGNNNHLPFAKSSYVRPDDVNRRMAGIPLPEPCGVSAELKSIILRACAYKPEQRYQTAEDFLAALSVASSAKGMPISKAKQGEARNSSAYSTVPAVSTVAPNNNSYITQPAIGSENVKKDDYSTVPAMGIEVRPAAQSNPGIRKEQNTPPAKTASARPAQIPVAPVAKVKPTDIAKLEKVASTGDAVAQYQLGHSYAWRDDGYRDNCEAVKWLRLSAEQGYVKAQEELAYCYMVAKGVQKDEAEAIKWYEKAAIQGSEAAKKSLDRYRQSHPSYETKYDSADTNDQPQTSSIKKQVQSAANPPAKSQVTDISSLEAAAYSGDAVAQYQLGHTYAWRDDGKRDNTEAVKWYKLSADQGNVQAQEALAYCYMVAKGVEKDEIEALKWYEMAANQGSASAKKSLIRYLLDHPNIDIPSALRWLFEAAEDGNAKAIYSLATRYNEGKGTPRNPEAALRLLYNAKQKGDWKARQLFDEIVKKEEAAYQEFLEWNRSQIGPEEAIKRSGIALPQSAEELFKLGKRYYCGDGVDQNQGLAVLIFQLAANAKFMPAIYQLGLCYCYGFGVPIDHIRAFVLFLKANSLPCAKYELGNCYHNGWGIDKNRSEAVKYYREAAEIGDPQAQYALAFCLATGDGISKDDDSAAMWFTRAAEQGYVEAQYQLGNIHRNKAGVSYSQHPEETVRAMQWYQMAKQSGHEKAAERYADVLKWATPSTLEILKKAGFQ